MTKLSCFERCHTLSYCGKTALEFTISSIQWEMYRLECTDNDGNDNDTIISKGIIALAITDRNQII